MGTAPWVEPAWGQGDIPGATLTNRTPDAGQFLGNIYKDEQAGFKLAPPVNARVISKAGSADLVTFVQDAKFAGGMLQRVEPSLTLDDYVTTALKQLSNDFQGLQTLENKKIRFQEFPAVRLTTSMQARLGADPAARGRGAGQEAQIALLRQQLIVQTKERGYLVLTYYAPLKDKEEAVRTFEAMVGSFEILNREDIRKKRIDAMMAGKSWLAGQTAEELQPKLNNQRVIYRMRVGGINGPDVGYIGFDERVTVKEGVKGVEIELASRSFPEGSLIAGKNSAFWAYSKDEKGQNAPFYAMWDNSSSTFTRLPSAANPTMLEKKQFWIQETGVLTREGNIRWDPAQLKQLEDERTAFMQKFPNRPPPPPVAAVGQQYFLLVNLSGDKQQMLPAGIQRTFPPQEAAPLPKVLEYTWTRLVELDKAMEMTFAVYNSTSRKLALRNLIVTGKKERIEVNGRAIDCWKCIDEMDPGSTTLWVDEAGKIISMRTSDQSVLVPTTQQEMERLWGSRVAEWQR